MTITLALLISAYLVTCGFAYHAFHKMIEEDSREQIEKETGNPLNENITIQLSLMSNLFVMVLGLFWPIVVLITIGMSFFTSR